ncbi:hypothetical protein [Gordonia sp. (in: high G+C Gram-positive bacteria)]|uniref:hypothetical protein n=1 Tax=Gordonia sp. (in: high G+C Gram-positive bacteria) TaxID=84139 RepID=UPI003F9E9074
MILTLAVIGGMAFIVGIAIGAGTRPGRAHIAHHPALDGPLGAIVKAGQIEVRR